MWNQNKLNRLLKQGKIRGFKMPPKSKKAKSLPKERTKESSWLFWQLDTWCMKNGYHLLDEHYFNKPHRLWRFDFAIKELMIAVEYEGIFSKKSRHTTASGYTGDTDKYNTAQGLGWRVIRLTATNYKTIIQILESYVSENAHR